jgi:hypothetical protein
MAFVFYNQSLISFATYDDLVQRDQRILEANEGITENNVDDYLSQASQRILTQIRNTDWWKTTCFKMMPTLQHDLRLLPVVDPTCIKSRYQEFIDLNVYFALKDYLYPAVADFGNPDSAEVAKINFYRDQYDKLFQDLIQSGDWYDFDADGTIETGEKFPSIVNRVRVR